MTMFYTVAYTRFNQNSSIGSRVVLCAQIDELREPTGALQQHRNLGNVKISQERAWGIYLGQFSI
jgi:hypothetical protein